MCGSRQYSLFDEVVIEELPESIAPSASGKPFIRFEAPDPRGLSIDGKPLGEHLQQAGLTMPLTLRPLLQSLSFVDFEARYQPGGRPPYAPRAMAGISLWHPARQEQFARPGLCPVGKRLARADVGCWWLSGGIMPDHSVIGHFVRQHETLLTTEFFDGVTRQVLKVTGSGTTTLAGGGVATAKELQRLPWQLQADGSGQRQPGDRCL